MLSRLLRKTLNIIISSGSRITLLLYRCLLLVLLCWGAHAWFTWEWDYMALGRFRLFFAFLAISLIYIYSNNIFFHVKGRVLLAYFLWCIASLPPEFKLVNPVIEAFRFFPLLILFYDSKNIAGHLKFLSISIALILIPGMILWTAIQLGYFNLPGLPIQMGEEGNDNYYFYNYFILLDRIVAESTRFQSIFLEPGYLGTMLSFLLYANKFRWHLWYNCIILLGLVLSQSLAGYATFGIGYLLFLRAQGFSIKKYAIPLFFLIMFVFCMQFYNNGDNYINHNIIERVTDESNEKYLFDGSDRTSDYTDELFIEAFTNGNLLFGINKDLEVDGAGYKIFFLNKGIIAAILYFLVYKIISLMTRNKKYSLYYLILIIITFWQAGYPYSYSWIIPFILGIILDNQDCRTSSQSKEPRKIKSQRLMQGSNRQIKSHQHRKYIGMQQVKLNHKNTRVSPITDNEADANC